MRPEKGDYIMFLLALNAGHGFETPGKRCLKSIDPNETREYVLNKRICDKLQNKLSTVGGISVLRIDGGKDISISARAKAANNSNADLYLAVHHNAGINGGSGGGIEAYVYLKVNEQTKAWQNAFYNEIIKQTGLKGNRSNGIKSADFGECRETKMPAVLMECGFMDSTTDTPVILTDDFAEKAAQSFFNVIVSKAGLSVTEPTAAPTVTENKTSRAKSAQEIANEVIAGVWGNGNVRRERLTAAGYDYDEIQALVNAALGTPMNKPKSNETVAREVINGAWGNGQDRKNRLIAAGYNYTQIQSIVNALLK